MKKKTLASFAAVAMSLLYIISPFGDTQNAEINLTASAAKMKSIDMGNSCLEVEDPYEKSFDITSCVNYAIKWYDKRNSEYKVNKWAKANCASYVSECLCAGGISINEAYRECEGIEIADKLCLGSYKYSNTEWSRASKQFTYLTTTMGYDYEKAYEDGKAIDNSMIHVGDVVYYDWDDPDKDINHAAICVGIDKNGSPVIAEHTNDNVRVWDKTKHSKIESAYVVHTTNTKGLTDVTSSYYDKSVSLKAMKQENTGYLHTGDKYYVSDSAQYFSVNKNKCFNYSELKDKLASQLTCPVSFKRDKSNYLSAYITEKDSPIMSTSNNSTWEAMRIYKKNNKYYIQSMQNGFFIQIQNDGKAYANGKLPSTWETFDIK